MGRWAPWRTCAVCGSGSFLPGDRRAHWEHGVEPTADQHAFWGGRQAQWETLVGPGPGRLLDVGCGFGHFVRWAADASWDAFGCDADPWAVERSEAPGRVVASLSDVKPPFDLVTLWDVLEHVAAPTSFAASLRPLIRPGGRLLVSSPNFAALQLRWAMLRRSDARFTAVLRPDEHVVQFTAQGLQCTLERAGYESVTLLDPPLSRPLPSAVDWLVRRTGRVRRGLFVEARVAA